MSTNPRPNRHPGGTRPRARGEGLVADEPSFQEGLSWPATPSDVNTPSPRARGEGRGEGKRRQPPLPLRSIYSPETNLKSSSPDWPGRARRNWPTTLSLLFLLGTAVLAAVPGLFNVPDPLATTPRDAFLPPSRAYLFGTDDLGRDLFSRTVYGARVSLGTAVVVVIAAAGTGVPLGLIAGYREGIVDTLLMRVIDVVLAFPAILLAMGLIAVIGAGWGNGALAVTIVSIPAFARLTRASVLQEKQKEYVLAARTAGAGTPRILARTILPNCLGPLLVQAAFVATWAILLEAALSFLGLGVAPPTPSWGQMLSAGKTFLYRAWWYGFFPGLALTLVVLSLNTIGETTQRIVTRGWRSL